MDSSYLVISNYFESIESMTNITDGFLLGLGVRHPQSRWFQLARILKCTAKNRIRTSLSLRTVQGLEEQ
jgi:hypothetical protein